MKKDNILYFTYARKSSEAPDKQIQSIPDQIAKLKGLTQQYDLNVYKKKIFSEEKSAKEPYTRSYAVV